MSQQTEEKRQPASPAKPPGATEPRCDECGKVIPSGIAAVWDVPLSAIFCSPPCRWRYREVRGR